MGRNRALVLVGGLLLALTTTIALLVAGGGSAAPVPYPLVTFGTYTCTTDANAYCSNIPHGLGVVPGSVLAGPKAPIGGTWTQVAIAYVTDSYTATTFRVRAINTAGKALTNASVTFSWHADATGAAPSSSPPPSSTSASSTPTSGSPTPTSTDISSPTDTSSLTATTSPPPSSSSPAPTTSTPPPPLQPVGDPLGRVWAPVMADEFDGASIDTSKWVALNGWGNNNVTSNAKNCTETGGNVVLALPGDGTGCDLYSGQNYGAGVNAGALHTGDFIEARMWFPGPGTAPTSTLYNWPAFWTYDGSGNWNGGENDIAEALGHMEYNYSSTNGSGTLSPPGQWGNSWHVYGLYRAASQVQVFYDGALVGTVNTNDNGTAEPIMFTSGKSNSCCGAPTVYGAAGNVLVDWVRDWH